MSVRGTHDARFDEPSEGLPVWLLGPVQDWVRNSFVYRAGSLAKPRWEVREACLTSLQLALRMQSPLQGTGQARVKDLLSRIATNDAGFGLDAIDWMLHNSGSFNYRKTEGRHWAESLDGLLRDGGSIWEVTGGSEGFQLTRRAIGPVVDVLEDTATEATRSHAHLSAAWSKLMGRNPDPSGAYREAVRAVEAVAKSVVLPNNDRATLGQMIAAMRDRPEKWSTTLGTIGDVRAQMEAVWTGQLDRHGTDDESVPLNVSPKEADAAFSTCLTLVRLFAGGHVVQADDP